MRMIRSVGLLAVVLLLLNGCATPTRDPDIEVSLANLRFSEATLTETTLDFLVRIDNATPETMTLQGGVHRLYINGAYLGKGMSGDAIEIPRFGSVTQPVKVHLSNLRMAGRIRQIMDSQSVSYRLQSQVYTARGKSLGSMREGTFQFSDLQR